MESDPIGLGGGLNTHLYANANPIINIDPYGLRTCGSGFNEPFVPDNPFGFNFSSCCEGHDNCYGNCGTTKKDCDNKFLGCMLKACESEGGPARKSVCKMWARRYYRAVKWFGESAYDAAQENCPDCNK